AEGAGAFRRIEVSRFAPWNLGEVVRGIRLDYPWHAPSRHLVRTGGSLRGRPVRILLHHGLPESPRRIPAARRPGEVVAMVLAGAEPKAGRDGAGPEHDRDGCPLLAESTEQGDGDRLPVRPRDGGMATRGLAALAHLGSGEHGGSIWLETPSAAARVHRLRDARPIQPDLGRTDLAPEAPRPAHSTCL